MAETGGQGEATCNVTSHVRCLTSSFGKHLLLGEELQTMSVIKKNAVRFLIISHGGRGGKKRRETGKEVSPFGL